MNEDILTASLLLMNAAMLIMVLLYFRAAKYIATVLESIDESLREGQGDTLSRLILNRLSNSASRERKILQRIAQVKTRLADEESDDQKAKAKARREVRA